MKTLFYTVLIIGVIAYAILVQNFGAKDFLEYGAIMACWYEWSRLRQDIEFIKKNTDLTYRTLHPTDPREY